MAEYLKSSDPSQKEAVLKAARALLYTAGMKLHAVYEHGQWWVMSDSGAIWSCVDASYNGADHDIDHGIYHGLSFEQISDGEEY